MKKQVLIYILLFMVLSSSVLAIESSTSVGTLSNDSTGFSYRKGVDTLSIKIKAESGGNERNISDWVNKRIWNEKEVLKYGFNFTIPNNARGSFVSNKNNNLTVYYEITTNSNFVLSEKKFVYSRDMSFDNQANGKVFRRILDFSDLSRKKNFDYERNFDSSTGIYTLKAYCLNNADVNIGEIIDCDPSISESTASDWANGTFYNTFNHSRGSLTVVPDFWEYGFLNESYLNNTNFNGFYVSYGDNSPNATNSNVTYTGTGCAWATQQCGLFNASTNVILNNNTLGESFYDGGYDGLGRNLNCNNFSVGLIFNNSVSGGLFTKGNVDFSNGWEIDQTGASRIRCGNPGGTGSALSSSGTINGNKNYFSVCVWNDSGLWLFVDGSLVANTSVTPTCDGSNNNFPTLGGFNTGNGGHFNGTISYYFFSKKPLSYVEVITLNSTWKTRPESLMRGYLSSGNYTSRVLNFTKETNITRIDFNYLNFLGTSLNLTVDANTSTTAFVNSKCNIDLNNNVNNCSIGVKALYFKYVINGSSTTNKSSFELFDINFTGNIIPGKFGLVLNSTRVGNTSSEHLHGYFRVDDPDNSSVNFSVTWYKNNVTNLTFSLLRGDNSSLLKFNLTKTNLSVGDSWHYRVNVTDGVTGTNDTNGSAVTIRSDGLRVVILSPVNGTVIKTGRNGCDNNNSLTYSIFNESKIASCVVEVLLYNNTNGYQTSILNRSSVCPYENDSFVVSLGCATGGIHYTVGVYTNTSYGTLNWSSHQVYLSSENPLSGGGFGGGGGGGVPSIVTNVTGNMTNLTEIFSTQFKEMPILDSVLKYIREQLVKLKGDKVFDFTKFKPDARIVKIPMMVYYSVIFLGLTLLFYFLIKLPFKENLSKGAITVFSLLMSFVISMFLI